MTIAAAPRKEFALGIPSAAGTNGAGGALVCGGGITLGDNGGGGDLAALATPV